MITQTIVLCFMRTYPSSISPSAYQYYLMAQAFSFLAPAIPYHGKALQLFGGLRCWVSIKSPNFLEPFVKNTGVWIPTKSQFAPSV